MLGNYIVVIEPSKILDFRPETVKRLIRQGKLTTTGSATSGSWSETGFGPSSILMSGIAEGREESEEEREERERQLQLRLGQPPNLGCTAA